MLICTAPASAAETITVHLVTVGPFPCYDPYQAHDLIRAAASMPETLKITRLRFWLGMDLNGVSDFYWQVTNLHKGDLVYWDNWDHYANPTAPASKDYPFADGHEKLWQAGDIIELGAACADYNRVLNVWPWPWAPIHGHVSLTVEGYRPP